MTSHHEGDVLADLRDAAATKWQGNPAAQRAGLFARAADEIERLRAEHLAVTKWREEGEALFAKLNDVGSSLALGMSLGKLWAMRPWSK